jgi:hypothetical protein
VGARHSTGDIGPGGGRRRDVVSRLLEDFEGTLDERAAAAYDLTRLRVEDQYGLLKVCNGMNSGSWLDYR